MAFVSFFFFWFCFGRFPFWGIMAVSLPPPPPKKKKKKKNTVDLYDFL